MADPLHPSTILVVASGVVLFSEKWANTFHFRRFVPGTPDAAEQQAVMGVVSQFYSDTVIRRSTTHQLQQLTSRRLDTAQPMPQLQSVTTNGSSTGGILPLQTSLVITLLTPVGGRRARGRLYTSGWTEDDNNAGRPEVAAITDYLQACDDLYSRALALTVPYEWVVVSNVAGGQVNPVVQARMDNVWDTQRRRTYGLAATRYSQVLT